MLNYSKINNITGWALLVISTLVYWLTVEPTASYWDCGEFIAVSYKLEVPHPPGAPLFLLIGRMFSFLAGDDVEKVAYWINISSVISSGLTIMFMFWTITMLGKRLFGIKNGEETSFQTMMIVGGGIVGALAYTFSDTFWFSAVEAEVYAMSSFFTAFVAWAILKWANIDDESLANKWIILIAYMMGLSIGVHLLNLVTIPALGLIYYFKKYEPSRNGIIITLIASGAILIFINNIIIPGFPSIAGWLEIGFVNSFGLPFGSGIIFFAIILIGAIIYGILYSIKHEKVNLNTALLSLVFILIGYSSYSLVVIRSNFNPPIDENNPENIVSFVSYLKREQYGSRPLLYGQYFDAQTIDQKQGAPIYIKGEEKYEVSDYKIVNEYDPKRKTIIPRMYSSTPQHVQKYREWAGMKQNEKPNFVDNIAFMFKYQIGYMYLRYFMWNFVGRESDIQGANWLAPTAALQDLPEPLASNRGRNQYFMLPLILGLIGLFFQFKKDIKSFSYVGLLFILTGVALVLYLNSPPVEPRERDYIYVGSYYAFAMWISFGVMAIANFLNQKLKNEKLAAGLAFVVCMSVPVIMAAENWDDHDRSDRYFSVDSAKNFLASCPPNAILFTGGDNDTFPLWYAQEVEGFRTDVRVIVLSYFNTDWYIDQMTRRAYESQPLPISLSSKNYRQGGPNDYLLFYENKNVKGAVDLEAYLNLVRNDSKAIKYPTRFGSINTVPTKALSLKIDTSAVQQLGIIPETKKEFMVDNMQFTMKGRGLEKNTLMILDIIATNNWERPICFNNTSIQNIGISLNQYLVQEGNAYRLLPVENPNPRMDFVNEAGMYDNMMNNFYYRQLNNPAVYYNEDYRNFVLNHRSSFNTLAQAFIRQGELEKAKEVLHASFEKMPDEVIPFDYTSLNTINLLFACEDRETAVDMCKTIAERAENMTNYFENHTISASNEPQKYLVMYGEVIRALAREGETELAKTYRDLYEKHR